MASTPAPPSFSGAFVNIPQDEPVPTFSDGSISPVNVDSEIVYSTTPHDFQDFINKASCTPDEISFQVVLQDTTTTAPTPFSCRAILDSGAGKNYFVCPTSYTSLIQEHAFSAVSVSLADGSTLSCTSVFKVSMSVFDINGIMFDVGPIQLIKLPSVDSSEGPYILLGREAMQLLQISLHGSSEAYIGHHCIYLSDTFVDERAELVDTAYFDQLMARQYFMEVPRVCLMLLPQAPEKTSGGPCCEYWISLCITLIFQFCILLDFLS